MISCIVAVRIDLIASAYTCCLTLALLIKFHWLHISNICIRKPVYDFLGLQCIQCTLDLIFWKARRGRLRDYKLFIWKFGTSVSILPSLIIKCQYRTLRSWLILILIYVLPDSVKTIISIAVTKDIVTAEMNEYDPKILLDELNYGIVKMWKNYDIVSKHLR